MTAKRVLFRSDAGEKVLHGAAQLADAVRITLGPKSKSVLIQKKWGAPVVCNDGVIIAKEMELEDAEENLGAQMLRQAAEKTGDAVVRRHEHGDDSRSRDKGFRALPFGDHCVFVWRPNGGLHYSDGRRTMTVGDGFGRDGFELWFEFAS